MAIPYNWICTACGAANVAGADVCDTCGINAVTSAKEIEQRSRGVGAAMGSNTVLAVAVVGVLLLTPVLALPLYLVIWFIGQRRAKGAKAAWRPFIIGLLAWASSTVAFIVASLLISPCLEGCSKYETPMRNFAGVISVLAYLGVTAFIAYRVHRSRAARLGESS